MTFVLTFLGKGGTGRTTVAIAAAQRYATQGKRTLLVSQEAGPAVSILLDQTITADPQEIAPNLYAVQLQTATLLERSWEELKQLEGQYLRTPFFSSVYGQELSILPGLDSALALNEIRNYIDTQAYEVIVYDSASSQETLRMLGIPEILDWYVRRFRNVFLDSDLGKAIMPFMQPLMSAVLTVNWAENNFQEPTNQMNTMLEKGRQAVADPQQFAAYLVTTENPVAVKTAQYLWGAAQQVGLTVGGAIANQGAKVELLQEQFRPLDTVSLPIIEPGHWSALAVALPDFQMAQHAPQAIMIDVGARQVHLFLPGLDKKQVKLTQYGPEITVEAGDQRRNILLPPELAGQAVTGAKFQDGYLILSL